MKNIHRLWCRYLGQNSLYTNFSVFNLKNKSPVLYFVNNGHSESRLKNSSRIKSDLDKQNCKIENKNVYRICEEVHGNVINKVHIESNKPVLHSNVKVNSLLNENQTSSSVTCHETIVHKYSRVPAMPNNGVSAIPIKIPTEPNGGKMSDIQRFFLGKFIKYLKKFQESLANEMPDTFHMFNTFKNGFKEFVIDFRDYLGVVVKMNVPFYDLEDLSRRELELYFNMPRQMIRVFPVVAVSSLPFAQNLALPIAYMFPRYLLCYQFWDKIQRREFPLVSLRKRLFNARPVFRSMQTRIEEVQDSGLREKCQLIFFSLGSGIHPTQKEILEVKKLFSDEPYQLNLLYAQHVNGLLRLYGRSAFIRRRNRLLEHARYIHCMDQAIIKEGLEMLNSENLRNMLILRGINPSGMSNIEMRDLLDKWIFISSKVDEESYSLLLHLPIFLAYNHPTNLSLLNS